jgi:hypothetical protein
MSRAPAAWPLAQSWDGEHVEALIADPANAGAWAGRFEFLLDDLAALAGRKGRLPDGRAQVVALFWPPVAAEAPVVPCPWPALAQAHAEVSAQRVALPPMAGERLLAALPARMRDALTGDDRRALLGMAHTRVVVRVSVLAHGWRLRLASHELPGLWAEALWVPGAAEPGMTQGTPAAAAVAGGARHKKAQDTAARLTRLLVALETRGRKRGSTRVPLATAYRSMVLAYFRHVLALREHPGDMDIAAAISMPPRTLARRIAEARALGWPWPPGGSDVP